MAARRRRPRRPASPFALALRPPSSVPAFSSFPLHRRELSPGEDYSMLRHLGWTCAGVALVVMAFSGTAARAQWAGDIPGKRPSNDADAAVIGDLFFRVEFAPSTGHKRRPRCAAYVYKDDA